MIPCIYAVSIRHSHLFSCLSGRYINYDNSLVHLNGPDHDHCLLHYMPMLALAKKKQVYSRTLKLYLYVCVMAELAMWRWCDN